VICAVIPREGGLLGGACGGGTLTTPWKGGVRSFGDLNGSTKVGEMRLLMLEASYV